jgi:hypothetical protein
MEPENILDKIKQLFSEKINFSILEGQIDIKKQVEYFELAKNLKDNLDENKILEKKDYLFDKNFDLEEKKKLLIELSAIEKVEAYRTIEKYVQNPDYELKDWALIAYQESRVLLESMLLNENQVFISTGLGGKANKLRYFVVIGSKSEISDIQKQIIEKEFIYSLNGCNAEIEKIEFSKLFFTVLCLFPLSVSFRKYLDIAVFECNQLGNFLNTNIIITNIKTFTLDEVDELLKNSKNKEEIDLFSDNNNEITDEFDF